MTDYKQEIEELADIEHQRWSDWQAWCHKILRENCPSPELEKVLERWDKQIATPYKDLSEQEKQSDRDQVARYFPILTHLINKARIDELHKACDVADEPLANGRAMAAQRDDGTLAYGVEESYLRTRIKELEQ